MENEKVIFATVTIDGVALESTGYHAACIPVMRGDECISVESFVFSYRVLDMPDDLKESLKARSNRSLSANVEWKGYRDNYCLLDVIDSVDGQTYVIMYKPHEIEVPA